LKIQILLSVQERVAGLGGNLRTVPSLFWDNKSIETVKGKDFQRHPCIYEEKAVANMHTVVAKVRNLLPDAVPPYDMALNISQNGNVCYDTATLRFMDYVEDQVHRARLRQVGQEPEVSQK
jgi:hypothetical protein